MFWNCMVKRPARSHPITCYPHNMPRRVLELWIRLNNGESIDVDEALLLGCARVVLALD